MTSAEKVKKNNTTKEISPFFHLPQKEVSNKYFTGLWTSMIHNTDCS